MRHASHRRHRLWHGPSGHAPDRTTLHPRRHPFSHPETRRRTVNLAFFIAWRYLKAERKGLFAGVTTSIGVAGVMVGVAALITTLSVMNGFQTDIQKKVIGAQAHL